MDITNPSFVFCEFVVSVTTWRGDVLPWWWICSHRGNRLRTARLPVPHRALVVDDERRVHKFLELLDVVNLVFRGVCY